MWFKMSLITSFLVMILVTTARAQTPTYQDLVIENTKPTGQVQVAIGPKKPPRRYHCA